LKFTVISDNVDTLVGMRLAGVTGVIANKKDELESALADAVNNPEIGIVMITGRLFALCPEQIYNIKLNMSRPLVVEIPDRHGAGRPADSITKYVREAIGVKI